MLFKRYWHAFKFLIFLTVRTFKILTWVTLFSIAMAFLESAVVIYIRELLYPGGFSFPLAPMEGHLAITEILREAATIIMLAAVGVLAGRNFAVRFAWFIFAFAVWDIFYYLFLYLLIGWPANLMVWDVLFLIPVTWTGPVLSPLIVCIFMITLSQVVIWYSAAGLTVKLTAPEWLMLVTGAIVVVVSFAWDYSSFILRHYTFAELWNMPAPSELFDLVTRYIPGKFNWWLFSLGSLVICSAIAMVWIRLANTRKDSN